MDSILSTISSNEAGCGIEAEGIIYTIGTHMPRVRIDHVSSAEWLIMQVRKRRPDLLASLGIEQASVELEIRSRIHKSAEQAIDEVLATRELVNEILAEEDACLLFEPVPRMPFEFFAATSNPQSRTAELIELWSHTPEGLQRLIDTVTASLQFNDSRLFKGVRGQKAKLELARRIFNQFAQERDSLLALNANMKDSRGRTRIEIASSLLISVKEQQFAKRGFRSDEIVIPPLFNTNDELQAWMCAHSGCDDFKHASSKDTHCILCKVKNVEDEDSIGIAEARFADAVNDRSGMVRIAHAVEGVLARAA